MDRAMEQFFYSILVRKCDKVQMKKIDKKLFTAGGKLRHLIRPKINSVRKSLEFLQTGSPLNVTEIHIFNIPYFMDLVYCEFFIEFLWAMKSRAGIIWSW